METAAALSAAGQLLLGYGLKLGVFDRYLDGAHVALGLTRAVLNRIIISSGLKDRAFRLKRQAGSADRTNPHQAAYEAETLARKTRVLLGPLHPTCARPSSNVCGVPRGSCPRKRFAAILYHKNKPLTNGRTSWTIRRYAAFTDSSGAPSLHAPSCMQLL